MINGDIRDRQHGPELVKEFGVDGIKDRPWRVWSVHGVLQRNVREQRRCRRILVLRSLTI